MSNNLSTMTLTVLLLNDHQIIKLVHSLISLTFLVSAVWLFYRSLLGYFRNLGYLNFDKILSYTFIVNLYLQLVFGLLLIAFPSPENELASPDLVNKMVTKRFWPVEHIVLMLFALFIANLGLILSINTRMAKEKHRKVLIYYSIAILMIILSLGSTYLV